MPIKYLCGLLLVVVVGCSTEPHLLPHIVDLSPRSVLYGVNNVIDITVTGTGFDRMGNTVTVDPPRLSVFDSFTLTGLSASQNATRITFTLFGCMNNMGDRCDGATRRLVLNVGDYLITVVTRNGESNKSIFAVLPL